jgi:hypothetical protein
VVAEANPDVLGEAGKTDFIGAGKPDFIGAEPEPAPPVEEPNN